MDEPEGEPVKRRESRRPICPDCVGHGETGRPRQLVLKSQDAAGTVTVPGRCPSCRGTGHAGT